MSKIIYALGFFDGVHIGHTQLLLRCHSLAYQHDCAAGVVTFGSHPDTLVLGSTPRLINSIEDREWLLREKYAMEAVLTLPFDEAMRTMPWEDFLEMLRREHGAAGFVCGKTSGLAIGAAVRRLCCRSTAAGKIFPAMWCRIRCWKASGSPAAISVSSWRTAIWPPP